MMMGLIRTILGLLILADCWQIGFGSYMCLAPRQFHAGSLYTVAITIQKVTQRDRPVAIQAALTVEHAMTGILKAITSQSVEIYEGETRLLTLNVPTTLPVLERHEKFILNLQGSGGLTFQNDINMKLNMNQSVIMVQTDKKIYKPGQTVNFRIMNVNKELQPVFRPLSVFIVNPDDNKLEHMDQLSSSTGVSEETFELSKYPTLGIWKIQVADEDQNVLYTYPFVVEEYVLPKFSVEVKTEPDFLIWNVYNLPPAVIVKSIYTYGQAVQGECKLKLSRAGSSETVTLTKKISETGIVEFVDINWDKLVGPIPSSSKTILAQVEVEDITGRKEEADTIINVYRSPFMVEILPSSASVLRNRLRAEFHIRVADRYGNLLYNKEVEIREKMPSSSFQTLAVRKLEEGQPFIKFEYVPEISDDEIEREGAATLEVRLKEDSVVSTQKELQIYRASVNGLVQLKQIGNEVMRKGDIVEFTVESNIELRGDITLSYLVISQGNIVIAGNVINQKIKLIPTLEMCPQGTLLVYMIQQTKDGTSVYEVVTDYVKLTPTMCLDKKVTVTFEDRQIRTGAYTDMEIRVDRMDGSNEIAGVHDVFYLGVDKSIVLLQGSTDLSENKVLDALGNLNHYGDTSAKSYRSAGFTFMCLDLKNIGSVLAEIEEEEEPPIYFDEPVMMAEADDAVMFKESSFVDNVADEKGDEISEPPAAAPKIRKDFPDTWLWGKAVSGANGRVKQTVKLPDTITSWQVSAFAINSEGLAYAGNPFELTGFQVFFLSMNLPYSIKRGEVFTLKITVFNYRDDAVNGIVRLKLSPMFQVIDGTNKNGWTESPIKINAGLASNVEFQINASSIGEMDLEAVAEDLSDGHQDRVIRKLLVKPEGEQRSEAISNLMILDGKKSISKIFKIDWPLDKIVPDSQRLRVKITGETMGQAISGLKMLVKYPVGCGEQNMVTTVPNIYGLQYIKSTNQKNMEKTEDDMKKNMKRGYQREVDLYKHKDGSYSAWGQSSGNPGSTWLTAFVIKSFAYASEYINVDSSVLQNGIMFLQKRQTGKGSFEELGEVLHKDIQRGTQAGLGMTVYVLLSMLETQEAIGETELDTNIEKAISYILMELEQPSSLEPFLKAMTAYTLSLAPSKFSLSGTADNLLTDLEDSGLPWYQKEDEDSILTTSRSESSIQLQTAAYVLLAYTRLQHNVKALNVMKWLQSKQNAQGGFISTQDTVLVLQALSEFGRIITSAEKSGLVTVNVPSENLKEEIDISGDRAILVQIVDVPAAADWINVTLSSSANAMAVVKVVYFYNTLVEEGGDTRSGTSFEESIELETHTFTRSNTIHNVQACIKSSLPPDTEMYVTTMNLPSGEKVVNTEMELLRKNRYATRVEIEPEIGCIHFYMDKIPERGICMQADIERQMEFANQLPGSAKCYSYYQPENVKEVPLNLDQSPFCNTESCERDSAMTLTSLFLSVLICTILSLLLCM